VHLQQLAGLTRPRRRKGGGWTRRRQPCGAQPGRCSPRCLWRPQTARSRTCPLRCLASSASGGTRGAPRRGNCSPKYSEGIIAALGSVEVFAPAVAPERLVPLEGALQAEAGAALLHLCACVCVAGLGLGFTAASTTSRENKRRQSTAAAWRPHSAGAASMQGESGEVNPLTCPSRATP
jgi:hypothetical protein